MAKWRCQICNYTYDEAKGDGRSGVPAGTRFSDLPDRWVCPICGALKEEFLLLEDAGKGTPKTTVSDVIVSELEKWGVTLVFGMPGTSSLGLVDAVRRNPRMRYVPVRHEGNGAMAASAYNKLTGRIAACITIAGPGASNLATGLFDAKQDRASVISINGQVSYQYTGPGGAQEIDQDAFFKPICVFSNTIHEKNLTVKIMTMALKHARLLHGVAQVSVPNNIQKETLDPEGLSGENCIDDEAILPDESRISEAARLLQSSPRPVILAGYGAYHHGSKVAELAEKLKAPIVTTWRAKGLLHDDHPWLVGVHGGVGPPQAMATVREADLILALGAGFSEKTAIPPGKRIIQVDIDPIRIGRYPFELALWGDIGQVLSRLISAIQPRQDDGISGKVKTMKDAWIRTLEEEASRTASPLWPPFIMSVLSRTVPSDALISIDVGDNGWWFGRNFRMSGQSFIMSGYLGTMGFGLPGAIAAKLAHPDRPVFCITGDGGFHMAMADFVTAVTERLPIIVVLLNNHELAMIRQEQASEGYPVYATENPHGDYCRFAEASGGKGYRVKEAQQLEKALTEAMRSDVPVIIDIETDPRRFDMDVRRDKG